jgi:hypothetical protein
LLPGLDFMRVPGVRGNGGDHPVRGDLAGHPPPPVGPVRVLRGSTSCPATSLPVRV